MIEAQGGGSSGPKRDLWVGVFLAKGKCYTWEYIPMSDMTMNKPGKATESMIKIKMSKAGIQ